MKPDRKKGQAKPARELQPPGRSRAEDPEPSAAPGRGLPVGLFVALALLLFWAMVYLDNHAGGFSPIIYQRFTSSNQLASVVPYDPVRDKMNKGFAVYNRPTCAPCHQPTGQGTPGTFPPLAGSEWVLENDPSRAIRIVLDGMAGPVTVKGQAYNGAMPPWRPTLNDEEVAHVLTYVRKSWGNNASDVTPEQVAAVRKETEGRATPWSADELQKVQLKQ